jgi:hypothetical protein
MVDLLSHEEIEVHNIYKVIGSLEKGTCPPYSRWTCCFLHLTDSVYCRGGISSVQTVVFEISVASAASFTVKLIFF